MRIRWRGLELPSRVITDKSATTATYGRFVAEPFERGFGATIGNSLRRILLSSLEGSAVTRVKIQGIQHEFSTIPGVVEAACEREHRGTKVAHLWGSGGQWRAGVFSNPATVSAHR